MFVSHLYVFFGEMSVEVFFPLFDRVVFLVLSCMSCLYILEINPLSVVPFAIIFSYSEGCLFTLFIVSFAVLLSLIRSPLFTFVFIYFLLSCMSCLYILEINPLSVASFANIFPYSVGCLFILFMISFAVQKLLSLLKSRLFIFAYVPINQEDITKKNYCCDSCQSYYCDLCPRVFCLSLPQGVL